MSDSRKQDIKDSLVETRRQLEALLKRLDEAQWNAPVYHGDEPWTVVQLVRHIADAERSLTASLEDILRGGEGLPADYDVHRSNSRRQQELTHQGPDALPAELAHSRARLLAFIDGLNDEDWAREGRYPSLEIIPIEQYLHRIDGHEARHTADIANAVGLTFD